jgi:hypothetical protein
MNGSKWTWILGLVVVATIGFVVYIAWKATRVVQSYTTQTPFQQPSGTYPTAGSQPGVSGGSTTSTTPSSQPMIAPSPLIAVGSQVLAAISPGYAIVAPVFGTLFGW